VVGIDPPDPKGAL